MGKIKFTPEKKIEIIEAYKIMYNNLRKLKRA